jgi:hypothetical protein
MNEEQPYYQTLLIMPELSFVGQHYEWYSQEESAVVSDTCGYSLSAIDCL